IRDRNVTGVQTCALPISQGVGVALGEAWAPEGVLLRARQHGGCVHAVEAEHARVPAGGYDGDVAGLLGDVLHRGVVAGDVAVVGGGGPGGGVLRALPWLLPGGW